MKERISVNQRGEKTSSCVYCRDPITARGCDCVDCGVQLHPECGRDLLRCPTLGCSGKLCFHDEPASFRVFRAPRSGRASRRELWPQLLLIVILSGGAISLLKPLVSVSAANREPGAFEITLALAAIGVVALLGFLLKRMMS